MNFIPKIYINFIKLIYSHNAVYLYNDKKNSM
jgi:hypothetical protein